MLPVVGAPGFRKILGQVRSERRRGRNTVRFSGPRILVSRGTLRRIRRSMCRDLAQILLISKNRLNWFLSRLRFLRRQRRDHWDRARAQPPVSFFLFSYNEATAAKFHVSSRSCIVTILSHADPFHTKGPNPRCFRRSIFMLAVLLSAHEFTAISSIQLLSWKKEVVPPWREKDGDSPKPVTDVTKDKIVRYGENHSETRVRQEIGITRLKRNKHNEEETGIKVLPGNVPPITTHNSNVILPTHSAHLSRPAL